MGRYDTALNRVKEHGHNSETVSLRQQLNNLISDQEVLRKQLRIATADRVFPHPAAASPGGGLAIHGVNTENVLTARAVMIRHLGEVFAVAADAEIDLSALTAGGDTVADNAAGVVWVYGNYAGTIDVETPVAAQSAASALAALAQAMPAPPNTGDVPIGAFTIVTSSLGGVFTIGTTALDNAAVTDVYYDLIVRPGIISAMASFALDAGAATFTYGAATGRLGSGTIVSFSGKANVTISGSNVADGNVGAWVLYGLADDSEIAQQIGATYASLDAAKEALETMRENPLLVPLGRLYVKNASGAAFVPGTTALDKAGITATFESTVADLSSIDAPADLSATRVNA